MRFEFKCESRPSNSSIVEVRVEDNLLMWFLKEDLKVFRKFILGEMNEFYFDRASATWKKSPIEGVRIHFYMESKYLASLKIKDIIKLVIGLDKFTEGLEK